MAGTLARTARFIQLLDRRLAPTWAATSRIGAFGACGVDDNYLAVRWRDGADAEVHADQPGQQVSNAVKLKRLCG